MLLLFVGLAICYITKGETDMALFCMADAYMVAEIKKMLIRREEKGV